MCDEEFRSLRRGERSERRQARVNIGQSGARRARLFTERSPADPDAAPSPPPSSRSAAAAAFDGRRAERSALCLVIDGMR